MRNRIIMATAVLLTAGAGLLAVFVAGAGRANADASQTETAEPDIDTKEEKADIALFASNKRRAKSAKLKKRKRSAAVAARKHQKTKSMTRDEKIAAKRNVFESRLEGEPVDEKWAQETEAKIYETAKLEQFAGTEMLEVSCRSTVCRMVVRHKDERSLATFVERFDFFGPPNQESWHHTTGNESEGFTTTYYTVKKGHFVTAPPPPPPSESQLKFPSGFSR